MCNVYIYFTVDMSLSVAQIKAHLLLNFTWSDEDEWVRAWIKGVDGNTVDVHYIDYNYGDTVKLRFCFYF